MSYEFSLFLIPFYISKSMVCINKVLQGFIKKKAAKQNKNKSLKKNKQTKTR
jgi:hypothetical protein